MKRFQIGFAAIIAILAISVTVASHAGAFKATKAAPAAIDCFTNISYFDASCVAHPLVLNQIDCSTLPPVNVAVSGTPTLPVDPTVACVPVASEVFCCAKIITNQAPLCGSTTRISQLFCKQRP
jgi:hypothetical protein